MKKAIGTKVLAFLLAGICFWAGIVPPVRAENASVDPADAEITVGSAQEKPVEWAIILLDDFTMKEAREITKALYAFWYAATAKGESVEVYKSVSGGKNFGGTNTITDDTVLRIDDILAADGTIALQQISEKSNNILSNTFKRLTSEKMDGKGNDLDVNLDNKRIVFLSYQLPDTVNGVNQGDADFLTRAESVFLISLSDFYKKKGSNTNVSEFAQQVPFAYFLWSKSALPFNLPFNEKEINADWIKDNGRWKDIELTGDQQLKSIHVREFSPDEGAMESLLSLLYWGVDNAEVRPALEGDSSSFHYVPDFQRNAILYIQLADDMNWDNFTMKNGDTSVNTENMYKLNQEAWILLDKSDGGTWTINTQCKKAKIYYVSESGKQIDSFIKSGIEEPVKKNTIYSFWLDTNNKQVKNFLQNDKYTLSLSVQIERIIEDAGIDGELAASPETKKEIVTDNIDILSIKDLPLYLTGHMGKIIRWKRGGDYFVTFTLKLFDEYVLGKQTIEINMPNEAPAVVKDKSELVEGIHFWELIENNEITIDLNPLIHDPDKDTLTWGIALEKDDEYMDEISLERNSDYVNQDGNINLKIPGENGNQLIVTYDNAKTHTLSISLQAKDVEGLTAQGTYTISVRSLEEDMVKLSSAFTAKKKSEITNQLIGESEYKKNDIVLIQFNANTLSDLNNFPLDAVKNQITANLCIIKEDGTEEQINFLWDKLPMEIPVPKTSGNYKLILRIENGKASLVKEKELLTFHVINQKPEIKKDKAKNQIEPESIGLWSLGDSFSLDSFPTLSDIAELFSDPDGDEITCKISDSLTTDKNNTVDVKFQIIKGSEIQDYEKELEKKKSELDGVLRFKANAFGTLVITISADDGDNDGSNATATVTYTYIVKNNWFICAEIAAIVFLAIIAILFILWLFKPAFKQNSQLHVIFTYAENKEEVVVPLNNWKKHPFVMNRAIVYAKDALLSREGCDALAHLYIIPHRKCFILLDKSNQGLLGTGEKEKKTNKKTFLAMEHVALALSNQFENELEFDNYQLEFWIHDLG